ncbi:MAG: hypothetical protein A2538_01485 [Candidatus Magasanikbacteria bacterium RIFOXYD2_FULL_41_14]|uniref:WxL domain-containing protein n=1 Tax=Candidatus Magasanikbacteria bacterium RIFOXYD2_FULL_41_14 TaxID=1798709 RepID=A0A1F6PDE1_9BACT|nr:MAG: hypothetical protein A2538_01485 [Candidatus Magasanikbacteria bacterium RIFOXYD2_FULL_41_14]
MRYWLAIFLATVLVVAPAHSLRAAMSSTDYYIYADDFSVGGGLSSGGSYSLQDTVGQSPTDISTGGSYALHSGYQYQTLGSISLSISDSSLSLGTLTSTGASSTAATTATITTDSATGYVLSISNVSGTSLAAVSDGAVDGDGSSEEYGVAASGSDAAFGTDQAVTSSLALASNAGAVSGGSATILTFKAVRGAASEAGSKSQSITLSAVANF